MRDHSYEVICYNYRCRKGEIDIIAKKGNTLVFCEVKYRKTSKLGHPLESVNKTKQRTIVQCAKYFILSKGYEGLDYRFDVIGILGNEYYHIENAFEVM